MENLEMYRMNKEAKILNIVSNSINYISHSHINEYVLSAFYKQNKNDIYFNFENYEYIFDDVDDEEELEFIEDNCELYFEHTSENEKIRKDIVDEYVGYIKEKAKEKAKEYYKIKNDFLIKNMDKIQGKHLINDEFFIYFDFENYKFHLPSDAINLNVDCLIELEYECEEGDRENKLIDYIKHLEDNNIDLLDDNLNNLLYFELIRACIDNYIDYKAYKQIGADDDYDYDDEEF